MLCLQQEFGSNVREQVQLGCWAFKCSTCFVLFILGKSILINFAQKQIVSTTESSYMEQAASCIKMCQPIFPTKHMHEHEASILICSVYLYMQLGNPIAGLLASGAWATDCMQTDRSGGNYWICDQNEPVKRSIIYLKVLLLLKSAKSIKLVKHEVVFSSAVAFV